MLQLFPTCSLHSTQLRDSEPTLDDQWPMDSQTNHSSEATARRDGDRWNLVGRVCRWIPKRTNSRKPQLDEMVIGGILPGTLCDINVRASALRCQCSNNGKTTCNHDDSAGLPFPFGYAGACLRMSPLYALEIFQVR